MVELPTFVLQIRRAVFVPCLGIRKQQKSHPEGWPKCLIYKLNLGAGDMNRTRDLLITNELLYRLSYTGDKL